VVLKDFENTTRLQKTGINSHMPEIDIFTQFRKPNTPHELLFCKVQLERHLYSISLHKPRKIEKYHP
jgi:hypothetical protein